MLYQVDGAYEHNGKEDSIMIDASDTKHAARLANNNPDFAFFVSSVKKAPVDEQILDKLRIITFWVRFWSILTIIGIIIIIITASHH